MTTACTPSHEVSGAAPPSMATGLRLGTLMAPMVFGVSAGSLALPSVAHDLQVSAPSTSWLLAAYALSQGAGTALFGGLSDARGVPRVIGIGAALLVTGTVGCLLAPDLGTLALARLLLGAGAGAMTASALALAAALPAEQRPRVLATMATTVAVFVGSGTVVGGAVTALLSWRCTLALPLLSLIGVVACRRLLARPSSATSGRIDLVGAALLVSAAGGVLVLVQSHSLRLGAARTSMVAVTALLVGAGLVAWTRHRKEGFVRTDVVGRPAFVRAALVGGGVFGGLYATLFVVPQLLVADRGWGVLATGAALMPSAVLGAAASRAAARLRAVPGSVKLVVAAALFAVLLAVFGLSGGNAVVTLILVGVALAAFGLTQAVLVAEVSQDTPPALRGTAAGALQLCHVMGGAVGSSVAGSLVTTVGLSTTLGILAMLPAAAACVAALELRTRATKTHA